jgi:hypothetical protein
MWSAATVSSEHRWDAYGLSFMWKKVSFRFQAGRNWKNCSSGDINNRLRNALYSSEANSPIFFILKDDDVPANVKSQCGHNVF